MKVCEWKQIEKNDSEKWETSCSVICVGLFASYYDGPKERGYQFCPYCGKPLKQVLIGEE